MDGKKVLNYHLSIPWSIGGGHNFTKHRWLVCKTAVLAKFEKVFSSVLPLKSGIISMTPIVSNKVHLFSGCRDIPKGKLWVFHFLKKVTYGSLD